MIDLTELGLPSDAPLDAENGQSTRGPAESVVISDYHDALVRIKACRGALLLLSLCLGGAGNVLLDIQQDTIARAMLDKHFTNGDVLPVLSEWAQTFLVDVADSPDVQNIVEMEISAELLSWGYRALHEDDEHADWLNNDDEDDSDEWEDEEIDDADAGIDEEAADLEAIAQRAQSRHAQARDHAMMRHDLRKAGQAATQPEQRPAFGLFDHRGNPLKG